MTSFGGGALVNTPTKHRVCQCVLGAQCCSYAYVFQLVRTRLSWIVTGRQENTKFLPAAALFTGKQFVSSDV